MATDNGTAQIDRIVGLLADFGEEKTVDYMRNRMAAGDFFDLCTALGCRYEARDVVAAINAISEAAAAAEFDRIFVAGRGTVRIERADYVIIAHCQSYTTIEVTRIKHTRWYVSAYTNDKLRRRDEFDALLTFDQLSQWIDNVIAADQDR